MPDLCANSLCCGCGACYNACYHEAITMRPDKFGFLSPRIDSSKCIDCKICQSVCPASPIEVAAQSPQAVYAVRAIDGELVRTSSSGGLFSVFANYVLVRGGIIYGVALDELGRVAHREIADSSSLGTLRGSKYVQSDVGLSYRDVKAYLEKGREVLFTGTPCQVAALRKFLGKDYAGLFCVDVVCHGVPSPMAWSRYLDWQERMECGGKICRSRISFRDKRHGWNTFSLVIPKSAGPEYVGCLYGDAFLKSFLMELCNRESCHECQYRSLRSGADLTMADFWKVEKQFQMYNDDKGVSMLLVNTDKGAKLFDQIRQMVKCNETSYEVAKACNPAIIKSVAPHAKREAFLTRLSMSPHVNYGELVRRYCDGGLVKRIVGRLCRMIAK